MKCWLHMRFSSLCHRRLMKSKFLSVCIYICMFPASTRIPKPSHDSTFSPAEKFHTPTYLYTNTRRSQRPTIFLLLIHSCRRYTTTCDNHFNTTCQSSSEKSTSINNKVNKFEFKTRTKHNITAMNINGNVDGFRRTIIFSSITF